jgi:hypothetical protein
MTNEATGPAADAEQVELKFAPEARLAGPLLRWPMELFGTPQPRPPTAWAEISPPPALAAAAAAAAVAAAEHGEPANGEPVTGDPFAITITGVLQPLRFCSSSFSSWESDGLNNSSASVALDDDNTSNGLLAFESSSTADSRPIARTRRSSSRWT